MEDNIKLERKDREQRNGGEDCLLMKVGIQRSEPTEAATSS